LSFKESRDETGAFNGTVLTKAEEQSKTHDIDPVLPKQRVRKMLRRFTGSTVDETVGLCTLKWIHRSHLGSISTIQLVIESFPN